MGDAERALGNHSGIVCIANRRDDIAGIVQTAEGTRDVDRKSTRLNSSHASKSRMPSSA